MEVQVKKAFDAGIKAYANAENIEVGEFAEVLGKAFEKEASFLEKVQALDEAFDDYQHFEELREIYVDLLMVNFFAEDVQKLEEDYLESAEWEAIEEETIDRGTELLNIYLYLRECADDEIAPSLEDYLKEFLLVDEDEFQDEYKIYEKVIANQILVESNYKEISKVASSLTYNDELEELFYPMVSFFYEPNPKGTQLAEFESSALNKSLDTAIYQIIVNFNK